MPEGCCPRFEVLLPVGGVGHRFAGPVFYRDFEKGVAALGLVVRDVQLRPVNPGGHLILFFDIVDQPPPVLGVPKDSSGLVKAYGSLGQCEGKGGGTSG